MFIRAEISPQFVEYLYKIYINKVQDKLNSVHGLQMNDYLKETFGIETIDVINIISDNYTLSTFNDMYIIEPNMNITESKSGEKMSVLIRLIDSGNRDIRGTHAFAEAEDFIKNNSRSIYMSYMYRKEREHVS